MPAPGQFRQRVLAVVAGLQPGEVLSYGDVAAEAGYPGAARAVGSVLARSDGLPWWRVVMADGRLAPAMEARQAALLAGDGVAVRSGRVALGRESGAAPGPPSGARPFGRLLDPSGGPARPRAPGPPSGARPALGR